MPAQQLVVEVPADGSWAEATRRHAGLRLEAFPLGDRTIVNATGARLDDADLARALALPDGAVLERRRGASRWTVLGADAGLETLVDRVRAAGVLAQPPLVWTGGRLRLAILSPDAAATDKLLLAFAGARVLSRRGAPARPRRMREAAAPPLLGSLTSRQAESLHAAIRHGYYENPRKVTTGDVAKALGISRSTFEEHLRAAESHVVRALSPLVRLRAGLDGDDHAADALQVYEKFSRELGLYVQMTLRGERIRSVRVEEEPPEGAVPADHPYLERILRHLATGVEDLSDLPVDLEVTPFEREVLEALRDIPNGQVLTYGELARRVGRPHAARAVGNAVARNPVPLVLPCHRVVPTAGGVGNYSMGGPDMKRKLLEREGAWPARKRRPAAQRTL